MFKHYISLWFYSKYKATNFNADIENTNNFKSFKYRAKLLGNTVADDNNKILKNVTIAVPLKCLSDFGTSLEMPLSNYKVELKLKCTNHCVFSAAGADNVNADFNNIVFNIKSTTFMFLLPLFSKSQSRTIKTS